MPPRLIRWIAACLLAGAALVSLGLSMTAGSAVASGPSATLTPAAGTFLNQLAPAQLAKSTRKPTSAPTNLPSGRRILPPRATRTATPFPIATRTATPFPTATRTLTPVPTATPTGAPAPAVYWGAYISGVPWDMSLQDAFEANTGKHVAIIHWGQPWIKQGVYQPFYAGDFDRVRARGAIPLIDWGSWDYSLGPNQPNFRLAEIYGGRYDAQIKSWATAAKAWGHPFMLRFDWEMNGWWQFPWSVQLNGNQPDDYPKAWRHVHDLFTQVGATNATWVWCPNIVGPQTTSLSKLYPGDTYVDWVAMDGYNWGTDQGNAWQSFAQVFGPTYTQLGQLAANKPIMIAEVASSESGGSKAAWIADALGAQLPNNYPSIKAFVWFDWNAGDPSLSWPIGSSRASVNAFNGAIASTYFSANQFANLDASPVRPLR